VLRLCSTGPSGLRNEQVSSACWVCSPKFCPYLISCLKRRNSAAEDQIFFRLEVLASRSGGGRISRDGTHAPEKLKTYGSFTLGIVRATGVIERTGDISTVTEREASQYHRAAPLSSTRNPKRSTGCTRQTSRQETKELPVEMGLVRAAGRRARELQNEQPAMPQKWPKTRADADGGENLWLRSRTQKPQ